MHRPVLVRLQGGLGNQLFQYAAALELSEVRRCDVMVYGHEDVIRVLEAALDARLPRVEAKLDLTVPVAVRPKEMKGSQRLLIRVLGKAAGTRTNLIRQLPQQAHAAPTSQVRRAMRSKRSVAFDGYFQHADFAGSSIDIVASLLAARIPAATRRPDTVGIFVRRGDYVSLGFQLSPDFYFAALEIADSERHCSVLVACDDRLAGQSVARELEARGWAAALAPASVQAPVHEDLFALAGCRHLVMSNSTYSWWGAKIGDILWRDENRRVIAPDPWSPGPERPSPPRGWYALPARLERDADPSQPVTAKGLDSERLDQRTGSKSGPLSERPGARE